MADAWTALLLLILAAGLVPGVAFAARRLEGSDLALLVIASVLAWSNALLGALLLRDHVVDATGRPLTAMAFLALHLLPALIIVPAALLTARVAFPRVLGLAVIPFVFFVYALLAPASLLAPALVFLAAAAILPVVAARLSAKAQHAPASLAAVALAALLLPGAFGGLVFAGAENSSVQRAEHEWSLTIEPEDPGAPYVLVAPFLVTQAHDRATPLDALRDRIRVTSGDAVVRILESGHVEVEAHGPVTIEAQYAFYGRAGLREAFLSYGLPDRDVTLAGATPAHVAWDVRMSGGRGHSCWSSASLVASVEAQGTARLEGGEGADDLRFETVCA